MPVVLNGIPFCLPGPIQGVYFYDSSALHRFFEDGQVSVSVGRGVSDEPRPIPATITRLWSGDRAQPEDLIRQLEQPVQLMHAAPFWTRRWQAFPLSERLNAATILLERVPTTPELVARAIGIDHAELKASIAETTRRLAEAIRVERDSQNAAQGDPSIPAG